MAGTATGARRDGRGAGAHLRARAGELDRSKPGVCYCRSGNRSARAAAFLARAGFNAFNMRGGYWPYAGRGYRVEA